MSNTKQVDGWEIKPIETLYKGYRFRSRLEARWAVFFDALGIEWEYEKEGYDLGEGGWYLPDFWLPTFSGGMFAEVKDAKGDFSKAKLLCMLSKTQVWLCEGVPSAREYTVYDYDEDENLVFGSEGVPNYNQAFGQNRMYWHTGWNSVDLPKDEYFIAEECGLFSAVEASRSARFEHGETTVVGGASKRKLPLPELVFGEKETFIEGVPLFRTITSPEYRQWLQEQKGE